MYHPLPILFQYKSIAIYSWGFMAFLAVLFSFFLIYRYTKKKKILHEEISAIFLVVVVGAFTGAKLGYVLWNRCCLLDRGGFASYGGFAGAVLFLWLYCRIRKVNFWLVADIFAPYLFLALAIGRIGCFLNWDDYGKITDSFLGITVDGIKRHATQLYMSFSNLLIFLLLLRIRKIRKKQFGKGLLFFYGLLFYSLLRFFIDLIRQYSSNDYIYRLAISQYFCIIIAITSIVMIKLKRKKEKIKKI